MKNIFALYNMVRGMNLNKNSHPTSTLVYETCTEGKQYAVKWGNNGEMQATKLLEIVHSGVCGAMRNVSV